MKTKLFICVSIFICLVSINFISAEPSYIFKQNSFVDLKVPCYTTNYALCPSTTTCNVTILYPDLTTLISQGIMTWNSDYFNYTIPTKLSELGKYPVTISCEGVYNGFSTFSFEVTPSGREALGSGGGLSLIGSIIAMLFVAVIFFLISGLFKNTPVFRFAFVALATVISITAVYYSSITIGETIGGFSKTTGSYSSFIYVIGMVMIIILIFILIKLFVNALDMFKIKKGLKLAPEVGSIQ